MAIGRVVPLQPSDAINLTSAYLLALLVVIGILEILREPQIIWGYGAPEDYPRSIPIEIVPLTGKSFKIEVLYGFVSNGRGRLSKTAENCDVHLMLHQHTPMPPISLPWNYNVSTRVKLDKDCSPFSYESVAEALNSTIFSRRTTNINSGVGSIFIIGFGLETTKDFYYAGEVPISVGLAGKPEGALMVQFGHFATSGTNFSAVESKNVVISLKSWNDLDISRYTTSEVRVPWPKK